MLLSGQLESLCTVEIDIAFHLQTCVVGKWIFVHWQSSRLLEYDVWRQRVLRYNLKALWPLCRVKHRNINDKEESRFPLST